MYEARQDGGNEHNRDQFVWIATFPLLVFESNLFNCIVSQIIQGLGRILYSLMTVSKQVYEVDIRNNREEPGAHVNKSEYSPLPKK